MATDFSPEPFQGIADPTRRRILELLAAASRPVRDLAARFPVSRPAISKHLRMLREAGLVTETRRGRERIYELVPGALDGVAGWVGGLIGAAAAKDLAPRRPEAAPPARPEGPPRPAGAPAPPRPARAPRRPAKKRRAGGRRASAEKAAPPPAADWRVW